VKIRHTIATATLATAAIIGTAGPALAYDITPTYCGLGSRVEHHDGSQFRERFLDHYTKKAVTVPTPWGRVTIVPEKHFHDVAVDVYSDKRHKYNLYFEDRISCRKER
jgi:hypothetical protein